MKTILYTATALAIVLGSTVALADTGTPNYAQPVNPTTSAFAPTPPNNFGTEGGAMTAPSPGSITMMGHAPAGFGHSGGR